MARMTFKAGEEYALKLSKLYGHCDEVSKKAIHDGAEIVADAIKANLKALPEEAFRYLQKDDKFTGVPEKQKKDLIESFGITKISLDKEGNLNTKLGFDGYGKMPTKKYKKGLPNQLLARAIESGSSVREKYPFVRPAVKAKKEAAIEKMGKTITEEIAKIMGGK